MAAETTAEENARKVLSIYRHYGVRPGGALSTQQFLDIAPNVGLSENDLLNGVRYGGEKGWFEDGPNGSMRLTEAGFAEI